MLAKKDVPTDNKLQVERQHWNKQQNKATLFKEINYTCIHLFICLLLFSIYLKVELNQKQRDETLHTYITHLTTQTYIAYIKADNKAQVSHWNELEYVQMIS